MAGTLTPDRVVAGGVAVVRDAGWSALSLRSVASDLGVTPMAIYRHVDDSAALLRRVTDEIARQIPGPGESGDLRADLRNWAFDFRATLAEYPGFAGHLLVSWFESAPALTLVDSLLTLTAEHGIDDFDAVAMTNAVFTFVIMRDEAERHIRETGVERRQLGHTELDLPRLRAAAAHYERAAVDRHFEYGLDALLTGMLGVTA